MNLEYKILWFEDELLWAQPMVREIKSFVEEMGFVFYEPRFEKDNSNIDNIDYKEYDLILMDYNLSNVEKGDVLISKIREHNFFSEIVFYSMSGASSLRQKVLEKELDGVYCADRPIDSFLPKVQEVIKATVKKVLDLNTIRGIVMAETSDMDEKMLEIISLYTSKLDKKEKIDFLEKRQKKFFESIETKVKKLQTEDIERFYYNRLFDSNQKWMTVSSIVKKSMPERESITKTYDEDVIKSRNKLAHVKETRDASGRKQLSDKDFIFNDQTRKEILNFIKKHEENFNEILEHLKIIS